MGEKAFRQAPPRPIDIYTQLTILLSGFLQQMGWFFFGFGMIFVLVFVPNSDWKYAFIRGPWETVQGVVVAKDPTALSVNDQPVWEYTHKFSFQGNEYVSNCYSVNHFEPGQPAQIKVNTRIPAYSKIQGTQSGLNPKFTIFVLIFPIVGLIMLVPGIRQQAKALDLLRNGEFTRGRLVSKDTTGTTISINNVTYPVYQYTFDFEYGGASFQAKCKTHITEPLEDEEQETILFYPNDPAFNAVYDGISSTPKMDQMGNYLTAPLSRAWVFLAPAFSIFTLAVGMLIFVF